MPAAQLEVKADVLALAPNPSASHGSHALEPSTTAAPASAPPLIGCEPVPLLCGAHEQAHARAQCQKWPSQTVMRSQ